MESQARIPRILNDVVIAYGDLQDPDWRWLDAEYDKGTHNDIVALIARTWPSVELTVRNTFDVSRQLAITTHEDELVLWLSYVGPYAFLTRSRQNRVEVVDQAQSQSESEILRICREFNLEVLDSDVLGTRIDLELPYMEKEDIRVFQALFAARDWLPWEDHS
jgi:hypothetical protein